MKFAIFGLGYIAKKHLQAIKDIGGDLIAAYDPYTSVGILDQYFPYCKYFNEFEFMSQYLDHHKIDYFVICTPNYLHYPHILYGITKAKVICEKPVTIDYEHYKIIENDEVYPILQMRENKEIKNIKLSEHNNVDIEYCTFRGDWYYKTWKVSKYRSGGLLYNIGIHIIDLCVNLFGECLDFGVNYSGNDAWEGILYFKNAACNIYLELNKQTKRSIAINNKEIILKDDNLHTEVYKKIVSGKGLKVKDIGQTMKLMGALNAHS